jgi:hypothetical protein
VPLEIIFVWKEKRDVTQTVNDCHMIPVIGKNVSTRYFEMSVYRVTCGSDSDPISKLSVYCLDFEMSVYCLDFEMSVYCPDFETSVYCLDFTTVEQSFEQGAQQFRARFRNFQFVFPQFRRQAKEMSALYKITTISDNGNEKSTEWGTWAMTKKDFRGGAAIWIAALVMPYGDLPYVHKIIITDKTGNNIYTFIIHPRSAFSSSTLKLTTLNRTKTCKSLKEAAGLFYEGMMKWIDYEFDVKDSDVKILFLNTHNRHPIMSFWSKHH